MVVAACNVGPWAVSAAPVDPIFASGPPVHALPTALNLVVGAYRDANGNPTELRAVSAARSQVESSSSSSSHGYLPIAGDVSLRKHSTILALGSALYASAGHRVGTVHTISGSGALRLAMEYLVRNGGVRETYVSSPTWPNQDAIIRESRAVVRRYRYYDLKEHDIDFRGMITDLSQAQCGAAVIFHACAHNPSGADLSLAQWETVADVVQENGLIPIFDMAYQGFASGDVDKDAAAVRMFVRRGIGCMIAQSYSKNLGLYNSRVGCLIVAVPERELLKNVMSQLEWIARAMYSSPPVQGARIVTRVLECTDLRKMWMNELAEMVARVREMRRLLYDGLIRYNVKGQWEFVKERTGMFVLLGLDERQIDRLKDEFGVFVAPQGRINVSGLTEIGVRRLAQALKQVLG